MVTAVDENAMRSNDDFSSSSDNDLANIANKRVKRDEFGYDSVDNEEPTSSITDSNDKPVATTAKGKGKGKGKARAKKSPAEEEPMSKAREVRLEQNRKAARESRRRKKVLQEELQRSVIFFSRGEFDLVLSPFPAPDASRLDSLPFFALRPAFRFIEFPQPTEPSSNKMKSCSECSIKPVRKSPPSRWVKPHPTPTPPAPIICPKDNGGNRE